MTPMRLRRLFLGAVLPLMLVAASGCDIVTADFRSEETAEWHKTYTLDANGRVEINNVNGKIDVQPSDGSTVDVTAVKKAKGPSPEAAKAALDRITFLEDASSSRVKVTTRLDRNTGGFFSGGSLSVEYHVKVPVGAEVRFSNTNGSIDVTGLKGRINAETTNGGVRTHDVSGQLEASTTNGGLDIDLSRVPDGGVKLDCTNGGIKVRLPRDAKATISASITNGGIRTQDLSVETSGEQSRRRLEGRLNGGGPRVQVEGTNGGITFMAR
jgi:putative adhesin